MGGPEGGSEQLKQPKESLVVVVMGSPTDAPYAAEMKKVWDLFGVNSSYRVASAHKTDDKIKEILEEFDNQPDKDVVYVMIAGRSNALGPFADFHTLNPVISAPLYSDRYGGADIFSSLRVPSGIAAPVAPDAEAAALHAIKILAKNNPELRAKLESYQRQQRERVLQADKEVQEEGLEFLIKKYVKKQENKGG